MSDWDETCDTLIIGFGAAGACAVGVASHRYVSGLSLADCVLSGRRVGLHLGKS